MYEDSFGVYNNFQPVASKSDQKFGTYEFGYYGTGRSTCKNTRGARTLPIICLRNLHSSEDKINLPFYMKYFILLGGFIITFTTWTVAAKCCNIGNCIRNCNDEE